VPEDAGADRLHTPPASGPARPASRPTRGAQDGGSSKVADPWDCDVPDAGEATVKAVPKAEPGRSQTVADMEEAQGSIKAPAAVQAKFEGSRPSPSYPSVASNYAREDFSGFGASPSGAAGVKAYPSVPAGFAKDAVRRDEPKVEGRYNSFWNVRKEGADGEQHECANEPTSNPMPGSKPPNAQPDACPFPPPTGGVRSPYPHGPVGSSGMPGAAPLRSDSQPVPAQEGPAPAPPPAPKAKGEPRLKPWEAFSFPRPDRPSQEKQGSAAHPPPRPPPGDPAKAADPKPRPAAPQAEAPPRPPPDRPRPAPTQGKNGSKGVFETWKREWKQEWSELKEDMKWAFTPPKRGKQKPPAEDPGEPERTSSPPPEPPQPPQRPPPTGQAGPGAPTRQPAGPAPESKPKPKPPPTPKQKPSKPPKPAPSIPKRDWCCEMLELPKSGDISRDQLRKAFRAQAMKWHPDRARTDVEEATRRFQHVREAYDYLIPVCT